MENAIRILHEAGFDAYDWSMGPMEKEPDHELNQPDYRDYAHHIREYADSLGIVCNQAHAPTPSSYDDPDRRIFCGSRTTNSSVRWFHMPKNSRSM